MVQNRIIFFATSVQPNPEEIDYWVDLSDNPYGGSIKYFNGTEWVRLAASGGTPDLSNYYTKTQINNLLNNKADVGDVDSKVDDEEVKDVIKDIQFNTSNPNGITMVMFKYDGSNKTVSIPVASTSSAGIITSKDFLDFVKQHQLQELHTEMIDTFADIRAKYQKKLIAGLNIEIDQETNVISASGDLAVQWDNITGKPDFKPVATSGDYNDLINKLKPGKDVSISEDNTISIAIDSDSLEQSLATLQSNIDKEAATARAAETKLGNDIATEKNRAQSAESANATAIANEVERATGVEEALRTDVEDLTDQVLILEKTKVNKVEGKGLSTNDYTTPEKNKLAAIEAEANKYVLPAATTTTLGGIIVGDRLSIDDTGKLVATYTYTLPKASSTVLGGVKIGSNITNTDGTISITKANVTSALGVDPTTTYVKKAGDTMTGTLTSSSTTGSIVFKGLENCDITNIYTDDGTLYGDTNLAIRNGLRFNWYDTYWYIGNLRGAARDSNGFGIANESNKLYLQVTSDYTTAPVFRSSASQGTAPLIVYSTTQVSKLNADMVDGVDVKDIEHTLYMQSTTKNYLKIQVNNKYFPNSYKIVEYIDGYIYVYQLLINAYSPAYTDLQLISGKVHTGIKTFYDLTKWYIETTESGINIYIRQPKNSNIKIYGVIHGDSQSSYVQFSVVDSLPSNVVSRNITFTITSQNLEELDWYGVSWSETSSNPDCIRIGNMDMHRSLPIQSMMKGYKVTTKHGNLPYMLRKLEDDWSKTIGGYYGSTYDNNFSGNDTNIMVLIPEFWWIDDYSPSSKTHNLKICPHAKPGWNHHKEAFVGAYEGILTNDSFYSRKGVVPSVNVTREKLRTAARNNGNANEYKWNIYTYNEHRAICHLFLVEYATRNSQKAVNTELTPEGFRQGGLGSGCTTGTATINGAQTWSFMPTGSSDSLGSGSGEVTVTIQQTDQSGSNTSTITRKCNRYRGIENPFGHVWKHTDDIISKYSIVDGKEYRSWSICENPINFSTNLTTKYTPICIEPVVTGYKTEIVITPTCDFFAHACTNGSESTYWCDYNWDNTDTSEHCLLIGGGSDDGGLAGLFALHSHHGVGRSSAHIGSRLTYLPWAE